MKYRKLGINFIDSARGYSVSEEYIGYSWLNRRDKSIGNMLKKVRKIFNE